MTTRRNFLAAAVATPVAVVPAVAGTLPTFACQPTVDGAAWSTAMAQYEALKAEDRRFHAEVYHPTMDPINNLAPPYKFQHVARNGHAAFYCFDGPDLTKYDSDCGGPWYFIRAELADARARYAQWLDAVSKVDAQGLNERSDAFGLALHEAERALLAMPAPNLAALEWKVDLLRAESADAAIDPDDLRPVLQDIRRLDGRDGQ